MNLDMLERAGSAAIGALLASYGIKRESSLGTFLAVAGGALVLRGLAGFCPVKSAIHRDSGIKQGIEIRTSLTINRPRNEVFAHWRHLENLPAFMKHLSDVRQLSPQRSRWVARIPRTDSDIEWEAVIDSESDGRHITWHSVGDAPIGNTGEVRFEDAPGDRGTEVHVHIAYRPKAGTPAARLVNPVFEQMVKEDIRRFKHVMEASVLPEREGQPTG